MINLKAVAIETREVEVEYKAIPGFFVKVRHVSRQMAQKLTDECTIPIMENGFIIDKRTDEDRFIAELAKQSIAGWRGLTVSGVEQLMLTDFGDTDPTTTVEYSQDNAESLLANSKEFMAFINATVFRIDSFRTKRP